MDIDDLNKDIKNVENKLKERFGEDFSSTYTGYGTPDDRFLIVHSKGKRYKLGGKWEIGRAWEDVEDKLETCTGRGIDIINVQDKLLDLVGEVSELEQKKRLLSDFEDIPVGDLDFYESA